MNLVGIFKLTARPEDEPLLFLFVDTNKKQGIKVLLLALK
jgi:hypothetical protein